jgi:hypothetical protein
MSTSFDRVRSRTVERPAPSASLHDIEGKRALFSSSAPEPERASLGSVSVECARCGERTVLSPSAAVRAALPSLVLGFTVGRGERESTIGVRRGRYGAYLRCPACGQRAWTRLTIQL